MPSKPMDSCLDCGVPVWRKYPPPEDGLSLCRNCRNARRTADRWMTCAGCGDTFRTSRWLMSKNKTGTYYCSTDCHMAATMRADHICDYCGSAYRDQNSGRTKYCSLECSRWARTLVISTKLTWKQCPTCDGWLCNPHRTYCSKACWKQQERKPCRRNTTCKDCGVPLPDQPWIRRCEPCRMALAEKMRRKHQRLAGCKNARQRARHHGVEYEYINRKKVFIRDGWRCGICGKKVDKRLKYPHPMSVSLDHIVPMSLGGGHLYRNVQCSHWLCNTEKCDTGAGDQLALLG